MKDGKHGKHGNSLWVNSFKWAKSKHEIELNSILAESRFFDKHLLDSIVPSYEHEPRPARKVPDRLTVKHKVTPFAL